MVNTMLRCATLSQQLFNLSSKSPCLWNRACLSSLPSARAIASPSIARCVVIGKFERQGKKKFFKGTLRWRFELESCFIFCMGTRMKI
jgi:hypothetical protein